jgi:signal transduction histidine kinase
MKLRSQVLLAFMLLTVLPLAVITQVVRRNVERRFTELDTRRVEDQIRLTREDLDSQGRRLATLLEALADAMKADNRFRLAVQEEREDLLPYLVDYAPRQMSLMDLDFLLIQDSAGGIISSGHFRGAFGLKEPDLPRLLSHVTAGQALISTRAPEGPFLALARTAALDLGGRPFTLTGGVRLDEQHLRSLGRDDDLSVLLIWPEGVLASRQELASRFGNGTRPEEAELLLRQEGAIVRAANLPLIDESGHGEALLLVIHDQAFLRGLLRDMNLHLLLVLVLTVTASVLLAVFLSGRISRPLRDLAQRTGDLDLDRLDADFSSTRKDEVGHLSRLLGQMTSRLRESVDRLRSAEHRATLGEVARQVNHDIRNGLTPLRNVLLHLGQVARDEPAQLPEVFAQRQATLEEGLTYLEDLASHYARLSPDRGAQPCRLAEIVDAALAAPQSGTGAVLENRVGTNLPPVMADPVSLRRIFDNLVRNALESLPAGKGKVAVSAFLEEDPNLEEMRIVVEVADTGVGIAPENLDRVFTDFFTTRENGTGLGLSNVRRLAADCGAGVRVRSEVGHGSTFTLSFPVASS